MASWVCGLRERSATDGTSRIQVLPAAWRVHFGRGHAPPTLAAFRTLAQPFWPALSTPSILPCVTQHPNPMLMYESQIPSLPMPACSACLHISQLNIRLRVAQSTPPTCGASTPPPPFLPSNPEPDQLPTALPPAQSVLDIWRPDLDLEGVAHSMRSVEEAYRYLLSIPNTEVERMQVRRASRGWDGVGDDDHAGRAPRQPL